MHQHRSCIPRLALLPHLPHYCDPTPFQEGRIGCPQAPRRGQHTLHETLKPQEKRETRWSPFLFSLSARMRSCSRHTPAKTTRRSASCLLRIPVQPSATRARDSSARTSCRAHVLATRACRRHAGAHSFSRGSAASHGSRSSSRDCCPCACISSPCLPEASRQSASTRPRRVPAQHRGLTWRRPPVGTRTPR